MIAVPSGMLLRPRAWWLTFWDKWAERLNPTYRFSLKRRAELEARIDACRHLLDRL